MKRKLPDQRAAAKRAALKALRRARRTAARTGVELSDWEGEFLGSVEDRIQTFGRAFGDPEKGAPGQALSALQTRKLKELDRPETGFRYIETEAPLVPWVPDGLVRGEDGSYDRSGPPGELRLCVECRSVPVRADGHAGRPGAAEPRHRRGDAGRRRDRPRCGRCFDTCPRPGGRPGGDGETPGAVGAARDLGWTDLASWSEIWRAGLGHR